MKASRLLSKYVLTKNNNKKMDALFSYDLCLFNSKFQYSRFFYAAVTYLFFKRGDKWYLIIGKNKHTGKYGVPGGLVDFHERFRSNYQNITADREFEEETTMKVPKIICNETECSERRYVFQSKKNIYIRVGKIEADDADKLINNEDVESKSEEFSSVEKICIGDLYLNLDNQTFANFREIEIISTMKLMATLHHEKYFN